MVIAITSDLIPRFYHGCQHSWSLETFIADSMDTMDINTIKFNGSIPEGVNVCYYRNDWKKFDMRFFQILSIRLAFILVFEASWGMSIFHYSISF